MAWTVIFTTKAKYLGRLPDDAARIIIRRRGLRQKTIRTGDLAGW